MALLIGGGRREGGGDIEASRSFFISIPVAVQARVALTSSSEGITFF
jgi:hypothetical protein